MNLVDGLEAEHASLRRLVAKLEQDLGDEETPEACDLDALKAARDALAAELRAHEAREERAITAFVRAHGAGRSLRAELEEGHRSVERFMVLLGAVSASCDGRRLGALREAVARLRRVLERHMLREERALFPLLRGALACR